MTFTVEFRPAGGWRVVDEHGHIAETGITSRETALAMAETFARDPSLCQGMLAWHKRVTERGPTTVQRHMPGAKPCRVSAAPNGARNHYNRVTSTAPKGSHGGTHRRR